MFKRANKITALLVAAASVMSIVPAMAADTTRIGNKQGTVKQGVAYADGKYSYYGFRTDDDHTGVYYNNGGDAKDTFTSDLEDYRLDTVSKYGTKYAYARENSNDDEYLVDLTTGKIVDDETAEQKAEASLVDLRASLKKAERYSAIKNNEGQIRSFSQIARGQFGDVWYKYVADGDADASDIDNKNGTKTIVKIAAPGFADGSTVTYGGKNYVCDSGAIAGQKANFVITVPTYATGTTVVANGKNYVCLNGSAIGDQTGLTAAVLADVKNDTTNFSLFSPSNAVIASPTTIKVEDSTIKEYLASDIAKVKAKLDVAYPAAPSTATNAVLGDSTKLKNQNALTAAVLADIKTNTGDLSKTFDVTNAEINTADGYIHIPSIESKELLGSVVTTATTGYDYKGVVLGTNSTTTHAGKVQYIGFSDENGKYIDANYVANMYVFSTEKGRAVKIQNYGEENDDAQVEVNLASLEAIDQDKDYIYAIAKVDVTGAGALEAQQYFLQKISKARGDQHSGAYLPKTVTSYELNLNETYDNGDTKDAAHALLDSSFDGHDYLLGAQVVNGNTIYVTRAKLGTENDNIKLWKLELKDSVKADVVGAGNFLKKDVDAPLVKKTGDTDKDVEQIDVKGTIEDHGIEGIQNTGLSVNGNSIYRHPEVSFDVTGNTWVVNRGEIVKFNGTDKKTMFTCDRAMNAIDVYDDSNLIAWDMDGDAYTTVKEGTSVTAAEATVVAPVVVTGWVQAADGTWTFNDTTGAKVTSKWINVGGNWYFLKADGVMATGWYQDGATWYYLQSSGAMATGWLNDNGTWYYLAGSGAMLSNTTVDGYKLGATGAWVK